MSEYQEACCENVFPRKGCVSKTKTMLCNFIDFYIGNLSNSDNLKAYWLIFFFFWLEVIGNPIQSDSTNRIYFSSHKENCNCSSKLLINVLIFFLFDTWYDFASFLLDVRYSYVMCFNHWDGSRCSLCYFGAGTFKSECFCQVLFSVPWWWAKCHVTAIECSRHCPLWFRDSCGGSKCVPTDKRHMVHLFPCLYLLFFII